jgi:hypothetical protein
MTRNRYNLLPDDIAQLTSGKNNPGALLQERSNSTWWEDIWDREMPQNNSYWPGWESLRDRIEQVICDQKTWTELRTRIRQKVTAINYTDS